MFTMRSLPVLTVILIIIFFPFFIHPVLAQSAQDWVDTGNKFNEQGRYQDAILAFEHALSIDSKNKYAWTGKSGALNGLNRNSEALTAAETALTIDPDFEYALVNKGLALANLNRFQEAIDTLNKALTINPDNPFAWSIKSNILNQMGKPQEALQAAERALSIDSTKADIWNSKGFALDGLKRFGEALDTFNKALTIDPDNPFSWTGKSNILNQMGKPDEALQAAERALSIDSTRADIWNSKGFALLGLKRNQEALDIFNKALSIDQNNKWSILGRDEAQGKLGQAGPAGGSTTAPGTDTTPPVTSPVPASTPVPQEQDRPFPYTVLILGLIAGAGVAGIYIKTRLKKGSLHAGTEGEIVPGPATGGAKESIPPLKVPEPDSYHHDVFISYSKEDKPTADAICASLEAQRIRCWIAPRDVLPGDYFPEAIIQAIEMSRIMVLVFSSHSNKSGHVMRELTKAVSKGVIIIPFRIEDVLPSQAMEYLIGVPHWLDAMTPPLEKHIQKLDQTVKILLEKQKMDGTGS
jgi:tetratricopeptide (TPR) repeat protein